MFKLFTVVLLSCAATWAAPRNEIDPHIVGGTPAAEGSYPFMVSLRDYNSPDFFFCGGAFISQQHVLTAAHCVVNLKSVKIAYGSVHLANQKVKNVGEITVHPKYDPYSNHNDIAILKLTEKLSLPKNQILNFNCSENVDGKTVTALGWGRTASNGPTSPVLLYLKKPITPNTECARSLDTPLHNGQICLGSTKDKGMCFGDSGSPLFYEGTDNKNYTVGIVSWGIPCAKGYPDVFTRVTYYRDFITSTISN